MNSSNPPLMKLNLVKKRTVITQDRKQANVGTVNSHRIHIICAIISSWYGKDQVEVQVITSEEEAKIWRKFRRDNQD
ncbi:hypothetical protein X798_04762 [Onchocerca flexuosa]|uniref:Uncharacterized protein n=1 Tax=Onchocerca flexuosa TaxID=387005 RepID=A0A238BSD3_9BILA|nr:hypothetical protein X798_04762 [Onchocerca flexuosa]